MNNIEGSEIEYAKFLYDNRYIKGPKKCKCGKFRISNSEWCEF